MTVKQEETEYLRIPIPRDRTSEIAVPQALRAVDEIVWMYIKALQTRVDNLDAAVKELQDQARQ